ncbi:MAG: histidine kinase dimerization/phosphoacceptor domain -containing protein [Candidatus Aminicenantales bacterium]
MKNPDEPRNTSPLLVLLGEPDPANAELIKRAFRDMGNGAEIEVAESLREFNDLAAARRPDIALLDLKLPGGNVLDVLSSPPETGAFPVLAVAAGGDAGAAAALNAGALDYIDLSPGSFAFLPLRVDRALREWRLRREARRNADALAESDASLEVILRSTADGIIAVSRDDRILFYNERFVEMWQIPPEVIAAKVWPRISEYILDQVVDPDGYGKKSATLSASLEDDFEIVRFKDGRVFDRVSRPMMNGDDHRGRMWTFSDVGMQIQTEAALRESEGIFRQFLRNSPIYVFIKDEKDRALRLSDNFQNMLGRPVDELLGKRMDELFPAALAGKMMEDDLRLLKTGTKVEAEEESGGRIYSTITFPIFIEGVRYVSGFMIDITDRNRMDKNLRDSLREKDVLLQEIHHRVKNNMQVISSLFSIQARHIENPECRQILKEGQSRIRSMSLVHEKLYQSGDLSKIDLPGYIESLAVHLFQAYLIEPDQVRLETDFEKIALDVNLAIPFGLILNELISNALKHGFAKGRKGVLRIRLRRGAGGEVMLRVTDNGAGIPTSFDFRKSETFGLKVVNLLVNQLGGVFDLDRIGGTSFIVTFRSKADD